eukprot:TRINITY_DN34664_c0_g1_i1.p1 TRINITY_DN34664_c0_g1~~TRINITY_DN34664_c0_g1_i1.p1  ORF type:complete len:569 (-),score=94.52 TRINITY_DN34664_c0_g1_i1:79-1785(-)
MSKKKKKNVKKDGGEIILSAKTKLKAPTQKPLHKLTREKPVFGNDSHKHQRVVNIGASKGSKNLLDNEEVNKAPTKARDSCHSLHGRSLLELQYRCAEEFQRWKASGKSREFLTDLVQKTSGSVVPIMAWERWQAVAKLEEQIEGTASSSVDPLLPELRPRVGKTKPRLVNDDWGSVSLQSDLQRLPNVSIQDARDIAAKLMDDSTQRCRALRATGKKDMQAGSPMTLPNVSRCKYSFDVTYRGKLLKLNIAHYEKLKTLYLDGKPSEVDEHSEGFRTSLYLVLQRYHSLLGHGMQCACSEHVFDALKNSLKVVFECFASPLNCRFPRYCSAFEDTDMAFGSLGSFFRIFGDATLFVKSYAELCPEGGSFEANPPFIPRVMSEMVRVIESLIDARECQHLPLSFVLVLPGWTEQEYWAKLTDKKNKRVRKWFVIAVKDHGFVSGAQHQRKDRLMDSTFDTAVFVLQNQLGSVRYVVPDSFEDTVREAFRKSLPTDAMRERRMKEGRGFGDKDGGGGVYKGKKKNRKNPPDYFQKKGNGKGKDRGDMVRVASRKRSEKKWKRSKENKVE